MKKILSLILCLAMLLSLGTLAISAESIRNTDATVVYANYGTATVDGLKDTSMHIGTMADYSSSRNFAIGATWNADKLVIGVSGVVIYAHNDESSQRFRTNGAYPFVSGGISFENGYAITATKAEGLTAGGDAAEFAMAAEETVQACAHYSTGQPQTGYNTGVFYVEYAIPMSELKFYDMGDGTLGTQMLVDWVGLLSDGVSTKAVNDEFTLVLTNQSVVANRDSLGRNEAANYAWGGSSTNQNIVYRFRDFEKPSYIKLSTYGGVASHFYLGTGSAAGLPAGVASVVEVSVAMHELYETEGPQAAESWTLVEDDTRATMNYTANPDHMVYTVSWAENGSNAKALVGFAVYNVFGEFRLYSTEATDAEEDHYLTLPNVDLDRTHSGMRTIRFEFDEEYNATVYYQGRKLGTMPAPEVTELNEDHPLNHYNPDTVTLWGIDEGTGGNAGRVRFAVSNMLVATEAAAANTAIETVKENSMFGVYGDQSKVDGNTYSVRFLAELSKNVEDYTALGYNVSITNNAGQTATTTADLTKVFETVGGDTEVRNGKIAVVAVNDVPAIDGEVTTFTVTPWVVTVNGGEKLYGESYTVYYKLSGNELLYTYDLAGEWLSADAN